MTTRQARDLFFPEGTHSSRAEDRAFAREDLIYNVTEDLLVLMERQGVSKKELARRLGRSGSYVTQLLKGARNMTLGTLSDVCFALGTCPQVVIAGGEECSSLDDGGEKERWKEEQERASDAHPQIVSIRCVVGSQAPSHWVDEAA